MKAASVALAFSVGDPVKVIFTKEADPEYSGVSSHMGSALEVVVLGLAEFCCRDGRTMDLRPLRRKTSVDVLDRVEVELFANNGVAYKLVGNGKHFAFMGESWVADSAATVAVDLVKAILLELKETYSYEYELQVSRRPLDDLAAK